MKTSFYQFSAKGLQGKEIKMETYKGKAVLVVNTASKCGLTPQFEGLEKRQTAEKVFTNNKT